MSPTWSVTLKEGGLGAMLQRQTKHPVLALGALRQIVEERSRAPQSAIITDLSH